MTRVSVITPCYNAARYIERTVASVRAQTLTEWEHIVVDDGSNDGSAAVVRKLARDEPRLKLIGQANGGVARARNAGYAASSPSSAYVLFLDADDCLEPAMLEVLSSYLDTHPQAGLAYCNYVFIDEQDLVLRTVYHPRYVPSRFGVRRLPSSVARTPFVSIYCWAPVMESLSLLRRSVYERTPGWDESIGHIGEGVDLFLQFSLHSEVHYVPRKLYRYRQHFTQATGSADRVMTQERKVYAKWHAKTDLSPEHQAVLAAARRFREGRLLPWIGWNAARRHLRRRQVRQAAHFLAGAARRYAASYLVR